MAVMARLALRAARLAELQLAVLVLLAVRLRARPHELLAVHMRARHTRY